MYGPKSPHTANPAHGVVGKLHQISKAKRIARPTSCIFKAGKDVINDPIFPFATVCK
jgi:hypothetical protein